MITPMRHLYEMEARQQQMFEEAAHARLVREALRTYVSPLRRLMANLSRFGKLLAHLARIRIQVSFDMNDRVPDAPAH